MATSKKPKSKSKPAAKKRAARILAPLASGSDSQLIAGIAVRVRVLERELKAANQKLDYCVTMLADRIDKTQEPHPIVAEALKSIDKPEKQ